MKGFAEVQSGLLQADSVFSEVTVEESTVMLRAVLNLFEKWELKSAEIRVLLGSPAERTLQRWRSGQIAGVPHDTVYRLGCLLGIHKALRYMFAIPERGYEWVKKPNEAFGGSSALDKMLQGNTDRYCRGARISGCRAGGLVKWAKAHRIIRTIYPPVDLFEDIAPPEDWEILVAAEARFNPRIRDTVGEFGAGAGGAAIGGANCFAGDGVVYPCLEDTGLADFLMAPTASGIAATALKWRWRKRRIISSGLCGRPMRRPADADFRELMRRA